MVKFIGILIWRIANLQCFADFNVVEGKCLVIGGSFVKVKFMSIFPYVKCLQIFTLWHQFGMALSCGIVCI